ncbi:MAG: alpha-L-fucosidase, partial [Abditibacteriaceae bacterium]
MITENWFSSLRYGMFVHYGLYSQLGRAEWVLNREQIPLREYSALADNFNPERFDAAAICDLAVRAGMRYIVFTTMHHDGFRLYDTKLTDFNSVKSCGRDLTAEIVEAARTRNLK